MRPCPPTVLRGGASRAEGTTASGQSDPCCPSSSIRRRRWHRWHLLPEPIPQLHLVLLPSPGKRRILQDRVRLVANFLLQQPVNDRQGLVGERPLPAS